MARVIRDNPFWAEGPGYNPGLGNVGPKYPKPVVKPTQSINDRAYAQMRANKAKGFTGQRYNIAPVVRKPIVRRGSKASGTPLARPAPVYNQLTRNIQDGKIKPRYNIAPVKKYSNPYSAPAINPYGGRIGSRGGGGEPPQTFSVGGGGGKGAKMLQHGIGQWVSEFGHLTGPPDVNAQEFGQIMDVIQKFDTSNLDMSQNLKRMALLAAGPEQQRAEINKLVQEYFKSGTLGGVIPSEQDHKLLDDGMRAQFQRAIGNQLSATENAAINAGHAVVAAAIAKETASPSAAATPFGPAPTWGNPALNPIWGNPANLNPIRNAGLRGSRASYDTGYIPTAGYATYNNVPDRLMNDILDGNLGPYSQQGLAAAAAAAAAATDEGPPFIPGDTEGGDGWTEGPPADTTTDGGFFGPQTMQDMMAMFSQMKALFGDNSGQLDQIMAMYTELQQSMMALQNQYIQSLIDAQKPVAPPVAPAPNLGPEAFVPPYISPSAQTGAYLEMSDPGMGALHNMNPLYLQSVQNMLQGLGYTGAGVAGRYGERSYTRPGGPGSLAIGDAAFENPVNYVGLPATERENAEAAMRYLFGEMGNSPRFAFPGRPQYPTRA